MEKRQNWLALGAYSEEFAKATLERFRGHVEWLKQTKRHDRAQRSWEKVYGLAKGGAVDITQLQRAGDGGEVTVYRPNRYARLIRDQVTLVEQTLPDYQPVAGNTDRETQSATKLSLGILQHYRRKLHLDDLRVERTELGLIMSVSYQHVRWDIREGEKLISPLMSRTVGRDGKEADVEQEYEGDFVSSIRNMYEVAHDKSSPDRRRPRWWIVKEPVDRYDLLAEYGGDGEDVERAILEAKPWMLSLEDLDYIRSDGQLKEHDDSIPVYYVYGDYRRSLPQGRMAMVIDEKTVLSDGPLDESRPGVFMYRAASNVMTGEPHTSNFDGLAIQQAYEAEQTTIISNHAEFGGVRLWEPKEGDLDTTQVNSVFSRLQSKSIDQASGQRIPPPDILAARDTSPELIRQSGEMRQELDTVMSGSPVTRGDPNATKGDSGSKAALLYAGAQNVLGGAVRAALRVDEDVATYMINSLKRHATTARVVQIVGRANTYYAQEYTSDKLEPIESIEVRHAEPARDTFSGRLSFAEFLASVQDRELREQLQGLILTGRLEPITEEIEDERMLWEDENERLSDLETSPEDIPRALAYEQHIHHIKHHAGNLKRPDVRKSPVLVRLNEQHIKHHVAFLTVGSNVFDAAALLATGQRPIAQMLKDGTVAPMGGGPPQEEAPPTKGKPAKAPGSKDPTPQPAKMPVNPATGERHVNAGVGTPPPTPVV